MFYSLERKIKIQFTDQKNALFYYCNDCKLPIKTSMIKNHLCKFNSDIIEYDSVLKQFFYLCDKKQIL